MISIGSLARSMQRLYEAAWHLGRRGLRGTLNGIGGAAALVLAFGWLGWVSHELGAFDHGRLLALPVELLLLVPLWAGFIRLMLSRRRSLRELAPSALVSAAAAVTLSWGTAIYVPRLIETDAQRYGVIGVAFALVSWLVLMSYLLVASAVVGAELTATLERPRGYAEEKQRNPR